MSDRICKIVDGSVELEDGGGDGAYDLLNVEGSPEVIGKAVAESLTACDLMSGPTTSCFDKGMPLFLTIRIRLEKGEDKPVVVSPASLVPLPVPAVAAWPPAWLSDPVAEVRKLYCIQYDGEPYHVQASGTRDAVLVWKAYVSDLWNGDYTGKEEPESVALLHDQAVIGAEAYDLNASLYKLGSDSGLYYVQAEGKADAIRVWRPYLESLFPGAVGATEEPESVELVDGAPVITAKSVQQLKETQGEGS